MALEVQVLDREGMVPALQAEWAALESRAAEPNAYLSPLFVLPLLRHLMPSARVQWIALREPDSGRLVAIAPLLAAAPSLAWPMRHSTAFTSMHSYLSGWLVEAAYLEEATQLLVDSWLEGEFGPGCIVWPDMAVDGLMSRSLRHWAERRGCRASVGNLRERATLHPSLADEAAIRAHAGTRRLKDWHRQRRRLAELGSVEWRLCGPGGETADLVDAAARFLELEHLGWRADAGTSLQSTVGNRAFFTEIAAGFASEGRMFFAETLLDGRVVASTCNLTSGQAGFAFKIGWDPGYARYGLGMLNELAMVEAAPARLARLTAIDSGTQPGSFIEHLWPGRVRLGTLGIARPGTPSLLLGLREGLQALRGRFRWLAGFRVPRL